MAEDRIIQIDIEEEMNTDELAISSSTPGYRFDAPQLMIVAAHEQRKVSLNAEA